MISGASSGIGRAIALELAQGGAAIHALGRSSDRLQPLVAEIGALGGVATAHVVDLQDDDSCQAFVSKMHAAAPRVDILVHSAGIVSLGPVASAPIADLDEAYRINLRAPFVLTQGLLPSLEAAGGDVVFINSGAGLNARGNWGQYAATKHGLKALADALRDELRGSEIRVLSVFPGRTATPMQQRVRELEGQSYEPTDFLRPEDVSAMLCQALALPGSAEVQEINVRPR